MTTAEETLYVGEPGAAHRDSLIDLLLELNRFYNPQSTVKRAEIEAHLEHHLLAPDSHQTLIIAADGARALGLTSVYLIHSLVEPRPDANRQCFMKELYVRADARGNGIGARLMQWVIDYARAQGCCRLDWNVAADNKDGRRFYERLGGYQVDGRLCFRLDRAAF
ncbi:GNAT family N-acetyltransferase [Sneathiella chungangensis]|uniref:GNAT family N-acetyltransferase n=1 Tax=Sneathiella chungangensis TaxID=1418234 RepID=A0A845MCM7_9PROT|nr:GNAT family N-acetyltransferase [Sneathiella chungangensis]MZR21442.1 GNAT family N-acetyltransferase [Sneathiella chungangensis]